MEIGKNHQKNVKISQKNSQPVVQSYLSSKPPALTHSGEREWSSYRIYDGIVILFTID